jgi:hypothetical protein
MQRTFCHIVVEAKEEHTLLLCVCELLLLLHTLSSCTPCGTADTGESRL